MKKILIFILVFFVFIVVFVSGFYFGFFNNKNKDYDNKIKTDYSFNITLTPTCFCPSPTIFLKKFKNQFFNFEFEYYPEWQIVTSLYQDYEEQNNRRQRFIYINTEKPHIIGNFGMGSDILIIDNIFTKDSFKNLDDYYQKYSSDNVVFSDIFSKEKIKNKNNILFEKKIAEHELLGRGFFYDFYYLDKEQKSHIVKIFIKENLADLGEKIINSINIF